MRIISPYASKLPALPTGVRNAPPPQQDDSAAASEVAPPKMSLGSKVGLTAFMGLSALGGLTLSSHLGGNQFNDNSQPVLTAAQPVKTATEKASKDIHIMAHVDATEQIIEPIASADLTQLDRAKQLGGDHVTVDVSMDRKAVDPAVKYAESAMALALMTAPVVGGVYLAFKSKNYVLKSAFVLAGFAVSWQVGMHGGTRQVVAPYVSAELAQQSNMERWSGHRVYDLKGDGKPQAASKGDQPLASDPKAITEFMASQMKAHPEGTSVVYMMGHGLGYRYSAGLPFPQFQQVLAGTSAQAGRPIDVVVLESCLLGNFEALNGMYPMAHYAVVTEESVQAGAFGDMLERAMQATNGKEVTPRELGKAMIQAADSDKQNPTIPTLALVDLQQLPSLSGAVDRLGMTLNGEIGAHRSAPIDEVIKATPSYPRFDPEGHAVSSSFKVADLRSFAQNLLDSYTKGSGASTPQAAQMRTAASDVLSAMDKTVVALHTNKDAKRPSEDYHEAGGISIQLPDPGVTGIEKLSNFKLLGLPTYRDSGSPSNWQQFVEPTSGPTDTRALGQLL